MQSYQYSLGKVLDHKDTETKKIHTELIMVSETLEAIQTERRNKQMRYERHLQNSDAPSRLEFDRIRMVNAHGEYLRKQVEHQVKKEINLSKQLEDIQQRWTETRLEVKVLERHREREQKHFQTELDRKAQHQMDEMALNQYHRKR